MKRKTALNPLDWIEAAFRSLTEQGPQGIRAEAIARDLKVSKGSFYWHFKDVSALKKAMLKHWEEAATGAIISELEYGETPAEMRLKYLVDAATGKKSAPYGGVLAETAIRDWGRYDKIAAQYVERVDKQRLAYLSSLFKECGFGKRHAQANANILYGALVGLGALSHHGLVDLRSDLRQLLSHLLLGSKN